MGEATMKYSVIIPCYNSEETIEEVVALVIQYIGKHSDNYEIILVNDYSKDGTLERLKVLAHRYSFVKVISLAKNFGQANAIMAGLNIASGDAIINLDDDLQTHPSQFGKLITKYQEGYDVVLAAYKHKQHSGFRNLLTRMGARFDELCLERPKHMQFTSFWIISQSIRDELIKYDHPFPYMEGLFLQTTRNIANVEVEHFQRATGESGYNLKKLVHLFLNCTNFTILPLRVATILGLLLSAVGFISAIIFIIRRLIYTDIVEGWTSLLVIILIFSGVILFCMGVLGEYIGRIFMCINHAPQFVIKEKINIHE